MTSANAEKNRSSAERYEALWNITVNDGDPELFKKQWKRLVKLNIDSEFLIGWPSFPKKASERMMERVDSHPMRTTPIDAILDWVIDQFDHVNHNSVGSSTLSHPIPTTFKDNIQLFFKNMQVILRIGKGIDPKYGEFWPWFFLVLKSLHKKRQG